VPTLLYGCEAWSLREDLFKRLRSFHNRCARSMCRVNLHHTFRHHITTSSLFRRLNLLDLDSYYHNRLLRWAGHVARISYAHEPGTTAVVDKLGSAFSADRLPTDDMG